MLHHKKDSIVEGDLVLIHIEDKPAFYGRVEAITVDVKPRWWQVKFIFLTIPYQITTWILDDTQIRGADFTMGGTPIRVEKLDVPQEEAPEFESEEKQAGTDEKNKQKASVLSLHKKKE